MFFRSTESDGNTEKQDETGGEGSKQDKNTKKRYVFLLEK